MVVDSSRYGTEVLMQSRCRADSNTTDVHGRSMDVGVGRKKMVVSEEDKHTMIKLFFHAF